MNARRGNIRTRIYIGCTVLTALGSAGAVLMEFLIFLGIAWDYATFNVLFAFTTLSTFGLLAGLHGLVHRRGWANAILLVSSIYIPVAFYVLTVRNFTPPLGWWLLLPVGLLEIAFATLGTVQSIRS
jgi:hypothetical protein